LSDVEAEHMIMWSQLTAGLGGDNPKLVVSGSVLRGAHDWYFTMGDADASEHTQGDVVIVSSDTGSSAQHWLKISMVVEFQGALDSAVTLMKVNGRRRIPVKIGVLTSNRLTTKQPPSQSKSSLATKNQNATAPGDRSKNSDGPALPEQRLPCRCRHI
jgi:hypothetical protein